MKSIRVSDQVWDAIAARGKFGETENDVLERVFNIELQEQPTKSIPKKSQGRSVLPPENTKCKLTYGGKEVSGFIKGGMLEIPGMGLYQSFSKPACEVSGTSLNGWLYWKVQLPKTTDWIPASDWRNMQKPNYVIPSDAPAKIKEKWIDVVLDVTRQLCEEQAHEIFTLQQLESQKLNEIVKRTQSNGKTPQNSLQFYLQRLRDDNKIEFIDNNGTYKLRHFSKQF